MDRSPYFIMSKGRTYDFVLLGATGYTGKLCAEYITTSLPSNIKWAIAGRSQSKLQSLASELKSLNSQGPQPDVLEVQLTKAELDPLAKKTKIILNTVGPYHLYGTPVVEACVQNGTHYLDVTGETPWIKEIITKYQSQAKSKGAILIPEIGIESCPSDLVAYNATKLVRKVWECGVMDIICAVHELKATGPSGGTLASGLGLMSHYPASEIKRATTDPFYLSPSEFRPEPTSYTPPGKLTGTFSYPRLGHLTTSITAAPNVAIVQRSAGLTPLFYGFNFTYEEYMAVASPFIGTLIHISLLLLTFFMTLAPFRFIVSKLATAPGSGPGPEKTASEALEFRAIAVAEQLGKPRKALSTLRYEGGLYKLTGIFLAEGAMALLEGAEELTTKYGAGFLTPSCLGDRYIERLQKAGVKMNVEQIGETGQK